MKRTLFAIAAAVCAIASSTAFAQATRTWVSGVGDDVNPCSRTAPCKTFAGAISKTAAGGEINVLDPGGFGTVTITKSITIDGQGSMASILNPGTNGIVVNAGASDTVILRNLEINGSDGVTGGTNGIRFLAGGQLHVENVNIYGQQQGIDLNNTTASSVFLRNVSIRDCRAGGVWSRPQASGTVTMAVVNSAFDGNARGIRAEDGTTMVVRDSHAAGNVNNGFVGVGVSRAVHMTFENVISAANGAVGFYAGNLTTINLSNTVTTKNGIGGWQSVGGSIISFGNNKIIDNAANNGPANSTVGMQ